MVPAMPRSYCNISEAIDNELENRRYSHGVSSDYIIVEFKIRFGSAAGNNNNSETTTVEPVHRSVMSRREKFIEEEGPCIIRSVLANSGVSEHFLESTVIPTLHFQAWLYHNHPRNLGRKLIKLLVDIHVHHDDSTHDDDDNDDDDIDDDDEEEEEEEELMSGSSGLNFKPATSTSIQDLKRFKYNMGTYSNKQNCSICLDELREGEEVASMPCQHVYHDVCIVKWLETSHLCPLCRHQMPICIDDI